MQVEEPLLGETLNSKSMHDTIDEAHETLSLCDLPLHNDQSVVWDQDFLSQSNGPNNCISSSSEHDYFEFFSPNRNSTTTIAAATTTTGFPPENIVFCGKLITYKQPYVTKTDSSILVESKKQKNNHATRGWCLLRWKLTSSSTSSEGKLVNSKNGTKSTILVDKKTYNTNKAGKKGGSPLQKISFLASSSSGKAKWYFFLFGISKFSSEIELRDIKSRQSRRRRSRPQSPPPMFRFDNCDEKVGRERNRGWGLWWLMCGGNNQSTTFATASLGLSPPESRGH